MITEGTAISTAKVSLDGAKSAKNAPSGKTEETPDAPTTPLPTTEEASSTDKAEESSNRSVLSKEEAQKLAKEAEKSLANISNTQVKFGIEVAESDDGPGRGPRFQVVRDGEVIREFPPEDFVKLEEQDFKGILVDDQG